jgi:hypothetical protein
MAGGSLHRDREALHKVRRISLTKDFGNANYAFVLQAIEGKVAYRFEIFRSVRGHGQKFSWDFVSLLPEGGNYHLRGGHHRVAATVVESISLKTIRKIATKLF